MLPPTQILIWGFIFLILAILVYKGRIQFCFKRSI